MFELKPVDTAHILPAPHNVQPLPASVYWSSNQLTQPITACTEQLVTIACLSMLELKPVDTAYNCMHVVEVLIHVYSEESE